MSRQAPGYDEHCINPNNVAFTAVTWNKRFCRTNDTSQAILVQCQFCLRLRGAGLDLDESEHISAPGDQIDLADGRAGADGENVPALQPEPPGREPLGPPPAALGLLAFHLSCWARS